MYVPLFLGGWESWELVSEEVEGDEGGEAVSVPTCDQRGILVPYPAADRVLNRRK